MAKLDLITKKIKEASKMPLENEAEILNYFKKSLKGEIITFYDWECLPRFIDKDKKDKKFINYLVDLKKIFAGKKIDQFTEVPRVIKNKKREMQTLKMLKKLGLNFRFVKFVADTNYYYITPESRKLGEKKIKTKFKQFKKMIEKETKNYPVRVKTVLFSGVINKNKKYDQSFKEALGFLEKKRLLSKETLQKQIKRTKEHVGITDTKEAETFAKRTIATYAAEGVAFDWLSKSKKFSNPIWLNFAEANKRTIKITNCLRRKKGVKDLPMIFL